MAHAGAPGERMEKIGSKRVEIRDLPPFAGFNVRGTVDDKLEHLVFPVTSCCRSRIQETPVRKLLYFHILLIMMMALVGCSSSSGEPPLHVFATDILSDQSADGDIAFDPVLQAFTITHGADTLFFGIDDLDPNLPEFRAFLDFPLDGSTGFDVVPAAARIVSAKLGIFINEVSFAPMIPTLLDLVIYPVSQLRAEDFNSPPLLSVSFDFFASDEENFVSIDVTSLMLEAQRLGLADFQVRFLLDFRSDIGFVGIENRPTVSLTAPLLTVSYTL